MLEGPSSPSGRLRRAIPGQSWGSSPMSHTLGENSFSLGNQRSKRSTGINPGVLKKKGNYGQGNSLQLSFINKSVCRWTLLGGHPTPPGESSGRGGEENRSLSLAMSPKTHNISSKLCFGKSKP